MKRLFYTMGLVVVLTHIIALNASAQDGNANVSPVLNSDSIRQYTQTNPLVYEDAWDLWPYSYRSDDGKDEGFNIDLLKLVMEKLNIPYVIKLKKRQEVLEDLKAGRADLTMGMEADFHQPYGKTGKQTICLFTHSVVWPKGQLQRVKVLKDLSDNEVIVHDNSYSHHVMIANGWQQNAISYDDMREAVLKMQENGRGLIVWNTISLKWLLHMCHAENLQMAPVDMPDGDYKFMSNNVELLADLDKAFTELRSEDKLAPIQKKWFYPEQKETGIPAWVQTFLIILLCISPLILLAIYFSRRAERNAIERGHQRANQLGLILQSSHLTIWLYDTISHTYTRIGNDGKPTRSYSIDQFSKRLSPNDFRTICEHLQKLENKVIETATCEIYTHPEGIPDNNSHIYELTLSVLRYVQDKPATLIGICNDVTEEREQQQKAKERLLRYQAVFDTAMVDMVYYDENGMIANMNERAQHTFEMDLQETLQEGVTMDQILDDISFDSNDFDYYYASLFLNSHGEKRNIKARKLKREMVYELQLVPVRNRTGKMLGIYGTGREITETVRTFQALQKSIRKVKQANKEVTDYITNINYVMDVGGVRMTNYSPDSHTLTIFRNHDTIQHTLTQSRGMTLVDEESKKMAMKMLNSMDNKVNNAIDAVIKTTLRIHNMPLYLRFRFIPIVDEQGQVTSYFGMCRDISETKATDYLLEKETQRAQEVENLKNSFLRNMSYEIRTPLNTVVGFSELFEQEHSIEDEELFIKEIKDSSSHLLQLINDILFLSRLDAHMIEMEHQPIDFSKTFEGHCEMGWSHDKKEGVNYVVENHYNKLVVDIDDVNVGRIIEQIASNAAQHTSSGTVRARYDYINSNLMIAIEDTGCGISSEKLKYIYERFASGEHKGTGLGLPISKELAEQLGGTIDISSTVDRGTTVWITIPCKGIEIERKKEL